MNDKRKLRLPYTVIKRRSYTPKYHKNHILIVGDTHLPFSHKGYLDFVLGVQRRVKCGTIVHIGDLVDMHACSYHEHDPDGRSPIDEMVEADKCLQDWYKAFKGFPVYLTKGNHDIMPSRKGKTVGLPSRLFRPFREIWNLPSNWKDGFSFDIDGVTYQHGTGYSGPNCHLIAAQTNMNSTVIGHTHSVSAIGHIANEKICIFGVSTGCGVDRHSYALNYQKDFKRKPILSCAIVTEGRFAQIFTMEL